MALFGKKKNSAPAQTVVASRNNVKSSSDGPAVFDDAKVKKSAADITPDSFDSGRIFKGPRGINSKVLEKSMEQLAIELKARDEREPEHYMIDGISAKDMNKAEENFEETVKEINDRQSKIEYGRIAAADDSDIDRKVEELAEKYDYITHGPQEEIDYGFATISEEEFRRKLDEFDLEKASKRREIINSMPGLTQAQKEKIKEFFDEDVMAKPMDYVNKIPELKQKDLDEIRKKLEKIYALERENDPQIKMKSL